MLFLGSFLYFYVIQRGKLIVSNVERMIHCAMSIILFGILIATIQTIQEMFYDNCV